MNPRDSSWTVIDVREKWKFVVDERVTGESKLRNNQRIPEGEGTNVTRQAHVLEAREEASTTNEERRSIRRKVGGVKVISRAPRC